jgi:phosphoserine phosphatase
LTTDLIVQGPGAGEKQMELIFELSGAERMTQLDANAWRLHDAQTAKSARSCCKGLPIDFNEVPAERRLADFGLLAMDMDSTLITIECIDEIADMAGIKPEVAAITAAAMRGEIDFSESLRRRVALLQGLSIDALETVYTERLQLSPGAEMLIARCKGLGIKTLLVSGGFSFFVERLQTQLGLDYARSNTLDTENGRLTGKVLGEVFGAESKAQTLREIRDALGLRPEQTIVIGDGANDLPMMAEAGVSIAYRAKPAVKEKASYALDHSGLDGVLNLFL